MSEHLDGHSSDSNPADKKKPRDDANSPQAARRSGRGGGNPDAGPTPDRPMDTELGRLAVEQGLATPEELEECVSIHENVPAQPRDADRRDLVEIMVDQGVLTPRQVARVKKTIEESRRVVAKKLSGQQIPGYQLLSELGSGAMATVYKARQLNLDRIVAIKVLPLRLSESADYVERFYKEGKAAAKLNHANIVQAFDVGEAGGYHYFVMEYVEGRTLYEDMAAGKVFSESEALQIILQITRALEHAHQQGLVHRDVKPKNIMLTKDGLAKLADMGLARAITDEQAAQAEAGRAFGTPYYISPEQIRGELKIDFRADIYSLGATLYHMVTGKVPFDGQTPAAVMHRHLKDPLVPPDHLNTSLSSGLGEVVEVMMAKDRSRRYASTTDLLVDLVAIAAGQAPPQARKQIDAGVLTGLTAEASADETSFGIHEHETEATAEQERLVLLVIILGAALGVSILLHIVQLVM